jgi:hypothetical protein
LSLNGLRRRKSQSEIIKLKPAPESSFSGGANEFARFAPREQR